MANSAIVGYRRKPKWMYIVPCVYLLFPLTIVIQLFRANPMVSSMQTFLTQPTLMLDIFCSVSAALCILIVSRYSLIYLVGLTVYFVGFKLFQLYVGGWSTSFELSIVAFWFAAPLLFLTTTLRLPYFYPEARWWKRPPRVSHNTRGTLYFNGVKFPVIMMDFSYGGAFVKLDKRLYNENSGDGDQRRERTEVHHPFMTAEEKIIAHKSLNKYPCTNESVHLVMKTAPGLDSPYKGELFEAEANVVWSTKAVDPMQHGLGLKFTGMSFKEKLKLKRYLKLFQSKEN